MRAGGPFFKSANQHHAYSTTPFPNTESGSVTCSVSRRPGHVMPPVSHPSDTPGPLPRVLWLPYAQKGDTYPVVPVVKALADRGADILVCALPSQADLARSLGLRFRPYRGSISYDWSTMRGQDSFHLGPAVDPGWFRRRVRAEVDEATSAAEVFVPDIVLSSSFVTGAGFAAELLGLPWVS